MQINLQPSNIITTAVFIAKFINKANRRRNRRNNRLTLICCN